MSYDLTREQEYDLIRRAQAGDERARTELIRANQSFIVYVLRKYYAWAIPFRMADMISEGNVGLVDALNRFDLNSGFRYITYATWRIRHHVSRYLYRETNIALNSGECKLAANKTEVMERVAAGEDPAEVGKSYGNGITGDRVMNFLLRTSTHVSFDGSGGHLGQETFGAQIPDPSAIVEDDIAAANDTRHKVDIAEQEIERLPERDRDIIRSRIRGETSKSIGDRIGVHRTRVDALYHRALREVRRRAKKRLKAG